MSKTAWKSLLVAVRDLDRSSRNFLSKAGQLAQRSGAKLHVLHVVAIPYSYSAIDNWSVTQATVEVMTGRERQKLEKLVAPLRAQGLEVSCTATWAYPATDGILKEVARSKPDLLLIKAQRHSRLGRLFISNTDWELIRYCTCPLWIVKSAKLPGRLAALAAVDPFHAHDKPARLDREILDTAQRIAGKYGRLGLCHAFQTPPQMMAALDQVAVISPTPAEVRRYRARANRAVDGLVSGRRITRNNRFLVEGDAATALNKTARRWKADVLVMGAVSRSALKRAFIGNTAERILDEVNCDIVVLKAAAKR